MYLFGNRNRKRKTCNQKNPLKGCQGSLGTLGNYCNIHREEKKIYINKTKQKERWEQKFKARTHKVRQSLRRV